MFIINNKITTKDIKLYELQLNLPGNLIIPIDKDKQ